MRLFILKAEEMNFDSLLKFSKFSSQLVQLDIQPLSEHAGLWEKFFYYVKNVVFQITLFIFILITVSFTIEVFVNLNDDFIKVSRAVANIVTTVLMGVKGFFVFYKREIVWKLIQDFKKVFESRDKCRARDIMKKHLDEYHRFMIIYGFPSVIMFLSIAVQLLLFITIGGEMKLPIKYWFPFDPLQKEIFPFILLFTLYVTWAFLLSMLAFDSLMYVLIVMLVMEFDILRSDFIKLKNVTGEERSSETKALIEHHSKLIKLSYKLQKTFDFIFLISFVVPSMILSFIAFIMASGSLAADDYSFFIPYFLSVTGQIFLICHFGEALIDASQDIADGAYESEWETLEDNKLKKSTSLIIQRARTPQRLTAMGFVDVSLATFSAVSFQKI